MSAPLRGRIALVTGATSGIGRASAITLARAGAQVVATGRRAAELEHGIGATGLCEGSIRAIAGDLDDPAFTAQLVREAGPIDILSNNAGTLSYAPLLDLTDAECEAMFRTNVLATLRLSRQVAAGMVQRGGGHIVMMTSLAAREIYRFGVIYAATKHALTAIASGMRLELQGQGVRVTEIRTGMVATHMRDRVSHPEVLATVGARKYDPLTAQEVADVVLMALTTPENACLDLIEMRPRKAAT